MSHSSLAQPAKDLSPRSVARSMRLRGPRGTLCRRYASESFPVHENRALCSASALLAILSPFSAVAQHASDNPVASAVDAFGLTLGLESIGLYFDQQGALSNRVVEGSMVHVGISEIGYAFPAPTGVGDYD
jgi:hypothetical protein